MARCLSIAEWIGLCFIDHQLELEFQTHLFLSFKNFEGITETKISEQILVPNLNSLFPQSLCSL